VDPDQQVPESAEAAPPHHPGDEVDGRAVRAAKDLPGRFDDAYYGARGTAARPPQRATGQGHRAFSAATRRRA
jgi:hypothetical protein